MRFTGRSLTSLIATLPIIGIALTMDCQTLAHEAHDHFSAGEPGHPQKTARTVISTFRYSRQRTLNRHS
jgi:hypothetical protein